MAQIESYSYSKFNSIRIKAIKKKKKKKKKRKTWRRSCEIKYISLKIETLS